MILTAVTTLSIVGDGAKSQEEFARAPTWASPGTQLPNVLCLLCDRDPVTSGLPLSGDHEFSSEPDVGNDSFPGLRASPEAAIRP